MVTPTKWTPSELETLRREYPLLGRRRTAELLQRSVGQVASKTKRLKLVKQNYRVWTAKDEEILRAVYPISGSAGVRERLPGRTRKTIIQRAKILGVPKLARFTSKEIALLRTDYQRIG